MEYLLWPTSDYLQQIFEPILQKRNYINAHSTLEHAKKNRYCPETTMIFLQCIQLENIKMPEDVWSQIFNYTVTENPFFMPTSYIFDKQFFKSPIFKSPNIIELDDCIITITKRINFEKKNVQTMYTLSNTQEPSQAYQLFVQLKKPILTNQDFCNHMDKTEKLFKEQNNLPLCYKTTRKYNSYNDDGKISNCYFLTVPYSGTYFLSAVQSWIHEFHCHNSTLDYDTNQNDILLTLSNGQLLHTPITNLVSDSLESTSLKDVHIIDFLDKKYIIFKNYKYDIYTSIQPFQIKIFKIEPNIDIDESLTNDRQVTYQTTKCTLIQTIQLPFTLNPNSSGHMYPDYTIAENIKLFNASIGTPDGSLLFFKSILPIKNYSLMQKEIEANLFAISQQQDKANLQKEHKYVAFKNSPAYQNANKEFDFSRKLEDYSSLTLHVSLFFLAVYYIEWFAFGSFAELCSFHTAIHDFLILISLEAFIIFKMAGKRKDSLRKKFFDVTKEDFKMDEPT